jgi:type I restriction enzyme, S subunit
MQRWVEIGEYVYPVKNWNPVREGNGNYISYIDISSVRQDEKAIDPKPPIPAKKAPSRARQLVKKGDVIVSTVRPNLNAVALVPELLDGATASTGFCVLRPNKNDLISEYLFHWVKSPGFVAAMVKQATGASYPAISDRIVLGSKLPLPPVTEQRRVAAILDKADELRAKRRATLAQLSMLTQSIFLDLFGDPANNPKNFPKATLGQIIEFVGGSQPPRDTFTYEPSPDTVRLVQIRDFKSDAFITYIPRARSKRFFDQDDVMIGRYGPPVFQIFRGLSGSYNVALMKALPRGEITKDFIFYLLQESKLHSYVVAHSERTAGQSGVNLRLLESYPAYLPPLSLQREFARRVSIVEKLKRAHSASLADMHALFVSLQHRAFGGEL